jgi:Integrase core domain
MPSNTASAVPLIKKAIKRGEIFRAHAFEYACAQNNVDHRLTKPRHPWTNGQVERMNRTIQDATVKRYYYDSHDQLRQHLADFVSAYNFARRLKTLKGLTPYEFICKTTAKWSLRQVRWPFPRGRLYAPEASDHLRSQTQHAARRGNQ